MTVLTSLGSGHVNDLARPALDDNVTVLPESGTLHTMGQMVKRPNLSKCIVWPELVSGLKIVFKTYGKVLEAPAPVASKVSWCSSSAISKTQVSIGDFRSLAEGGTH